MDSEHLPQRVLVLCRVDIPIQQTPHHIQEGRIVLLQLHLTWTGIKSCHLLHESSRVKSGEVQDNTAQEPRHSVLGTCLHRSLWKECWEANSFSSSITTSWLTISLWSHSHFNQSHRLIQDTSEHLTTVGLQEVSMNYV